VDLSIFAPNVTKQNYYHFCSGLGGAGSQGFETLRGRSAIDGRRSHQNPVSLMIKSVESTRRIVRKDSHLPLSRWEFLQGAQRRVQNCARPCQPTLECIRSAGSGRTPEHSATLPVNDFHHRAQDDPQSDHCRGSSERTAAATDSVRRPENLCKKGYAGTTLSEIARAAGVGKKTLYNYVGDKLSCSPLPTSGTSEARPPHFELPRARRLELEALKNLCASSHRVFTCTTDDRARAGAHGRERPFSPK